MNTAEKIQIPMMRKIPQTTRSKSSLCSIQNDKNLTGTEVNDLACYESAHMNKIYKPKFSNTIVQPRKSPTTPPPAKYCQENQETLRKSGKIGNLESGPPLAATAAKLQTHTSPFPASDCQIDSTSRPSHCSAQPGQPIRNRIELLLAKTSLLGSLIGGRQVAPDEEDQ